VGTNDGMEEVRRRLDALWKAHMRADFPRDARGAQPAGVDLVLLDAQVAGLVVTWHSGRGSALDHQRLDALCLWREDLDAALPLLPDGHASDYFRRVREITDLLLGLHTKSLPGQCDPGV
jgi:hypothetical protein